MLSDDQERDGASVFEGSDPVEVDVAEPALQLGFRIVKRWVWGCDVWMRSIWSNNFSADPSS